MLPASKQETSCLEYYDAAAFGFSEWGTIDKWLKFTLFVRIKHANRFLLELKYFTAALIHV